MISKPIMDKLVDAVAGDRDLTEYANQKWLMATTFAFFAMVYFLSFCLSMWSETYGHLKRREQVFWHLSLVRGVFGVFAAAAGIWALLYEDELHRDVVMGKTRNSYFMMIVTCGFFIFECTTLYVSNVVFRYFDPKLAVHHSLALIGYLAVLYYDCNHFFAGVGLILEMSTPSSALCWVLIKANRANTPLWKANQMLLIHLFHGRSFVETYLFYRTYMDWERVWAVMPTGIFCLLYGQLALICFWLTPSWTYKKTWQLFHPVDWNHPKTEESAPPNANGVTAGGTAAAAASAKKTE